MAYYKSVLIVDDDPTQIAILTAYFSGLRVITIQGAADPADALAIIKKDIQTIDLIVSDLQMPRMDGLEFMRHLKTLNYMGSIALISSVNHNLLDHAGRLAKMHSLDFIGQISKPLKKATLDKVFCREVDSQPKEVVADATIITQDDFAKSLANNEIVPFYQPKIDVFSRRIVGAEALARWERPGIGHVPPELFINFAEQNGRIEELTFYLFNKVLEDLGEFLKIDPEQKIAINLAPELMSNIALPDQLCGRMKAVGIEAKNVSFEITENSILNLGPTTLEVLSRLRILDFEVAIDDFGTGSSNIQTLRDFPYSELKIDRSFISNAVNNVFSRETVHASVALAREQDMRIVAEGIEDQATWDFVKEQGIEHAQGFFMAKPMPAKDYMEFVLQHKGGLDFVADRDAA